MAVATPAVGFRGETRCEIRGRPASPLLPPPGVDCGAMPTVVSAKFEDLVAVGLNLLISEDPNLDLVAAGRPPGARGGGRVLSGVPRAAPRGAGPAPAAPGPTPQPRSRGAPPARLA